MDEEVEYLIDMMILAGFLEVAGVHEKTGEFLYQFTPKLQEANPELFYELQTSMSEEIISLWSAGFLEIYFDQDEPMVKLTEKCRNVDEIDKLTEREQQFLLFIVEKFYQ